MPADSTMRHYLAPLFEPDAVAIIGASERKGSVGAVLIGNMLATNQGMFALAANLGFEIGEVPGEAGLKSATLALGRV